MITKMLRKVGIRFFLVPPKRDSVIVYVGPYACRYSWSRSGTFGRHIYDREHRLGDWLFYKALDMHRPRLWPIRVVTAKLGMWLNYRPHRFSSGWHNWKNEEGDW